MESDVAEQVLQYVRGQRDNLIELLKKLVDAESPSSTPDSHQLVLSVLHEAFGALDFEARMPRVAKGAHVGHGSRFSGGRKRCPGRSAA